MSKRREKFGWKNKREKRKEGEIFWRGDTKWKNERKKKPPNERNIYNIQKKWEHETKREKLKKNQEKTFGSI